MINKFKRGITIAAGIVAIAIFSIVAGAGVSLAVKSLNAEKNNIVNLEVSVHAENALACYRAVKADGLIEDDEFKNALTGEGIIEETVDDFTEETPGEIILNKSSYSIVIRYNATKMTFKATGGDKTILEYTYGGNNE